MMSNNIIRCQAIHHDFRVCCGLPEGHITDHVGMIGKVPVVWPNSKPNQAKISKAAVYFLAGVFAGGSLLAFVWAAISLAG